MNKTIKRSLSILFVAILFITSSLFVSAYGMGGATVYISGNAVGNGYIWSNGSTFCGSTESSIYGDVYVKLQLHVSAPIPGTLDGYWQHDVDGYVETSLPSAGATSSDMGYGFYQVSTSSIYSSSHYWNG